MSASAFHRPPRGNDREPSVPVSDTSGVDHEEGPFALFLCGSRVGRLVILLQHCSPEGSACRSHYRSTGTSLLDDHGTVHMGYPRLFSKGYPHIDNAPRRLNSDSLNGNLPHRRCWNSEILWLAASRRSPLLRIVGRPSSGDALLGVQLATSRRSPLHSYQRSGEVGQPCVHQRCETKQRFPVLLDQELFLP